MHEAARVPDQHEPGAGGVGHRDMALEPPRASEQLELEDALEPLEKLADGEWSHQRLPRADGGRCVRAFRAALSRRSCAASRSSACADAGPKNRPSPTAMCGALREVCSSTSTRRMGPSCSNRTIALTLPRNRSAVRVTMTSTLRRMPSDTWAR